MNEQGGILDFIGAENGSGQHAKHDWDWGMETGGGGQRQLLGRDTYSQNACGAASGAEGALWHTASAGEAVAAPRDGHAGSRVV